MAIAPVLSTDPDLAIDVDCTAEANITAAGGTVGGSGETFDSFRGYNPGASSYISFSNFPYVDMQDEFTVIVTVSRNALSRDQSTSPNPLATQSNELYQSTGDTSANNHFLMVTNSTLTTSNNNFIYWGRHLNGSMATFVRRNAAASGEWAVANYMESDVGKSEYVTCMLVCKNGGRRVEMWYDGVLTWYSDSTEAFSEFTFLANWWFGGDTSRGLGDHWLKRIQLITRAIDPTDFYSSKKIGVFGDSTTNNGLPNYAENTSGNTTYGGLGIPRGGSSWCHILQNRAFNDPDRNLYLEVANYGQDGHAIDPTDQSVPLDLADDVSGLLALNPDIVILHQTINELHLNTALNSSRYSTALEDILDAILDGGVSKILLVSPVPFHKVQDKTTFATNGFFTNDAHRTQAIENCKAAIAVGVTKHGYRNRVVFADLWNHVGGERYDNNLTIGGADDRSASDVAIQGDIHQAPLLHATQGEFAWLNLRSILFPGTTSTSIIRPI